MQTLMFPTNGWMEIMTERFQDFYTISKRQKFVLASLLLGAILIGLRLMKPGQEYQSAIFVGVLSALVIWVTLWEDLSLLTGFILPILPAFFATGATLFSSLLPGREVVIVIYGLIFAFSMYALFLTENVFGVAAIRTIQLVRAAHAVGFLFTILTGLLLYNVILAFHLNAWINGIVIGLLSFPLVLHGFWVMRLEPRVERRIWKRSGGVVLILTQAGFAISFLPAPSTIGALFLTSVLYGIMGLVEHDFYRTLKDKAVIEYAGVIVIVFMLLLWQSSWRG